VKLSLVWFKRDLRIEDHRPLVEAAQRGPVIGLYVYEPIVLRSAEHSPRHHLFVNDCLREIRGDLRSLGSELLLRRGEMTAVLDELHTHLKFDQLTSHEETGLGATFARDRAVRRWCQERGVRWTEYPQHGVFRPHPGRDGWSRRWTSRMADPPVDPPSRISPLSPCLLRAVKPGNVLQPGDAAPDASIRASIQRGGASRAKRILSSFLFERGEHYQRAMSSPIDGWNACSRLSPHIAYGSLSIRTCAHAAATRKAELRSSGRPGDGQWESSMSSFEKRLRWHCHFIQKLEDEPAIEFRNFNKAYDGLRNEDHSDWTEVERARFEAWRRGQTGFPIVDACIRCLRRTGWINFRMRAMLMSFASYHLWLHWKPSAIELARLFTDFEPGIHYPQCQMQAGVTGINTIRIYSPAKQTIDQDPKGEFIRRWVPELEAVPDEYIAEPHQMPLLTQMMARCRIGDDYPAPVVDPKAAYREARDRIFAVRKSSAARAEAQRVYMKHGSRKPATVRGTQQRPMDDRGGAVERTRR
jgi:deoxyribodipyrimidine photo-lyase